MSSLVLYTYPTVSAVKETDPYYNNAVKYGEKVFVYGKPESKTIDPTNEGIVLKRFGKAKIYKVNEMAVNHMDAINLKKQNGVDSYNKQRLDEIKKVDKQFAQFFLTRLHDLVWQDYSKGILSTISFDEGFEMLKKATHALYDLLIASVDDKFSKDLSISEMKNVIDLHNLNNEYALGKDLKSKKH
jgi:hypothetical protein